MGNDDVFSGYIPFPTIFEWFGSGGGGGSVPVPGGGPGVGGDGLGAGENGPGVGGPGPGGSGPETGPKETSDPGGLGSESFFMNKMMAEMEIISGQVTETDR